MIFNVIAKDKKTGYGRLTMDYILEDKQNYIPRFLYKLSKDNQGNYISGQYKYIPILEDGEVTKFKIEML